MAGNKKWGMGGRYPTLTLPKGKVLSAYSTSEDIKIELLFVPSLRGGLGWAYSTPGNTPSLPVAKYSSEFHTELFLMFLPFL
jgi:hypothetical protein